MAEEVLHQPVTALRGAGPKLAEKLQRLGLYTVQDVLFHLPLRYQDRTRIYPIGGVECGRECVVVGTVEHMEVVLRRRRMLLCRISDGTGALLLRFFHFNANQQKSLSQGTKIRCFGEIREGAGLREIIHPEYRVLRAGATVELDDALTPIYPATEGVQQPTLRKLTDQALLQLPAIKEWLPSRMISGEGFPTLPEALRLLHRPPPSLSLYALEKGENSARARLAFEEILAHQLSMLKLREEAQAVNAVPLPGDGGLRRRFLEQLPFDLTGAQQRAVVAIEADMALATPMLRLVQGDVGCGKTVVAAMACLAAIESGYQAAMMAPTEILADQHFKAFRDWFNPLGVQVVQLSGKQKVAEKREALGLIASGEASLVVGTHALFQESVVFSSLALAVIDEQHRFGVHQRMALREKGATQGASPRQPHQLIMTATPIPRTLAMTAYADLDLTVIDELPPGRTPVKTVVMSGSRRSQLVRHVADACGEGRQAYWVCTLVEESEVLQAQAAEETYKALSEALVGLQVGLVHGRMKAVEKEAVMQAFKEGGIALLVATTVIEVGVDVPAASLMVIENAERLGLSQLHQLRGRVGRGATESSCVLLYQPPLSETGRKRLGAMRDSNDGFYIAEIDLQIRGPGELLGTRQTGELNFRVAQLERDQHLLERASELAEDYYLENKEAADELIERWIGHKQLYRQA